MDRMTEVEILEIEIEKLKVCVAGAKAWSKSIASLLAVLILVVGTAWYDVVSRVKDYSEDINHNTATINQIMGEKPERTQRLVHIESSIVELKVDIKSMREDFNKVIRHLLDGK